MWHFECSTVGGIMNIRTGNLTIENSIIAENTAGRCRPGCWGLANLSTTDGVTPTFAGQHNYWGSMDEPSGEEPSTGDGIYGVESTSYPLSWCNPRIGRETEYRALSSPYCQYDDVQLMTSTLVTT